MSKPTVLITRRWPEPVETEMRSLFEVEFNTEDRPMSASELREALSTLDAVCPTVTDVLDAGVMNVEPLRSKIIGNFGVGYNHIDLDTASRRGLVVTNTPEVLTDCTADLAMTLLLMVARRTGEGERQLRAGAWQGWRPTHMLGTKVSGKTLGIIGLGRIGVAVARRARHGFNMRIIYHNPKPVAEDSIADLNAGYRASIEDLLGEADFVSVHCPGGSATRHLLDAARLAAMKPDAFLINAARGDVVDQSALIEALDDKLIAGAALDVYEDEPGIPERMRQMENIVLLPHLGSATHETRVEMGMRVVENLKAYFEGGVPPDRIV